jgi:mannose-6-phosphate isomerase-like protein (cupin superfamily)
MHERLMARASNVELRLCELDPASEADMPLDDDHDRVAYVQEGALIVAIGDDPPAELHPGDCYLVPAGERCVFEVLEPATLVEAIGRTQR